MSVLALATLPLADRVAYGSDGSSLDSLMDEITVTARKREEGLQDTPIAVSAFSGESLEARGIDRLDGIMTITPNVTFVNANGNGGSSNNAQVYIRGVGQQDFVPTSDPGVGMYVDGVYLARSVGAVLDLIDVERIEVLRGPQGTLFGRNTIGGAISIHTIKPHEEFDAKIKGKLGSDERRDLQGKINIPLTDNLFAALSLASQRQDGFIENETTGKSLGDDDTLAARGSLRWLASDDLELNFSADYNRSRTNGNAVRVDSQPNRISLNPDSDVWLHNVLLGVNSPLPPFIAANMRNGCDATPANPAGTNQFCANANTIQLGENSGNTPSFDNSEIMGTSITLDWTIADGLDFKSITAYRKISSHFRYDSDATPFSLQDQVEDLFEQEQISQEFQLLGTALDDRLSWILGAYYFTEDGDNTNPVSFVPIQGVSGGGFENESRAVFAQATYDLTDQLHLTLGLRYTHDDKEFSVSPGQQLITVNLAPPGTALQVIDIGTYDVDEEDLTPMVNLSYDWNDELMTYITYSEGFKSGGFQQRVAGPLGSAPEYEPEYVDSLEVGFKYRNSDNSFVLNGAAFYAEYTDIQLEVFRGIAPILENAGEAEMQGLELEVRWAPLDTWFVEGAMGYLDTEITKADPAATNSGGPAKGDTLPDVPEWTASVAIIKEFDLGDIGVLRPRVDWSYRSKIYFSPDNNPFEKQDAYSLFNASVAWTSVDGKYSLTLLGSNLGDKDYLYSNDLQDSFGVSIDTPARGREWYLTGEIRFE